MDAARPSPAPRRLETREPLEQLPASSHELSIFVGGRTGSGKSTLVNALLGKKDALEGAGPNQTTTEITCHEGSVNGVRVKVWDSPGPPHRRNASEPYFSYMASSIAHSDLFVFCINVGDAVPFDADAPEVKCVETLTRKLSPSLWNHAVVALTFANRLGQTSAEVRQAKQMNDAGRLKELFCRETERWREFLKRDYLPQNGLSPAQVSKLKIIPIGHRRRPSLPDRRHWLSTIWLEILPCTSPRGQPALLRIIDQWVVEHPDTVDEDTLRQYHEQRRLVCREIGGGNESADLGARVGVGQERPRTGRKKRVKKFQQRPSSSSASTSAGSAATGTTQREEEESSTPKAECGGPPD